MLPMIVLAVLELRKFLSLIVLTIISVDAQNCFYLTGAAEDGIGGSALVAATYVSYTFWATGIKSSRNPDHTHSNKNDIFLANMSSVQGDDFFRSVNAIEKFCTHSQKSYYKNLRNVLFVFLMTVPSHTIKIKKPHCKIDNFNRIRMTPKVSDVFAFD